ncbi:D-alanyl-D-alanine carboxypeptidase/D-alanyl-D-alanine-endopeptidase [Roseateles saccharophilus]|uniref:D-alanyl-D-alanine carboxypeptidase/D-alanyl-D-alanine-endopeptidase (Penicillin-binding protein 4) n=1 Tax=Roseateles saccharophilus TaxID=304 RepID=A0A4R3VKV9_ROSSA|nr:D-alanyl-D-alanine carboxypeptidase/D-alanyl-D-alanine-endopeptidase [Roseateles saccharophilus]MDG0831349.1 D-alanyl-D-alanine carboxypeptidase/D-alanyl-D-alanine-endopeptidase [Roseateles saccharophilus]TCV04479.1 D-alanyl-D-alanine carboxypeptidase/D-alanyl-D-alanine-endopeptidase (penicillin-binding protein 4) [Roseateles saccharophilus]
MRVWPFAAALLLAGCAARPLPDPVQAALDRAGLPADSLGFVLQPLDGSRPALQRRAEEAMAPGSTMKLVTAVVALERLGINHRGHTELLAAAPPVGGVLDGPLILRGGADPDLDWPALWWLLRQLRESGLREIRGGLVVDRTLFNPTRFDTGQPPFDEAPEFDYNVIPDALQLNGSLLDIELRSTEAGVAARSLPALAGLSLDAGAMTLSARPCKDWDEDWKPAELVADGDARRLKLHGAFPRGCRQLAPLQLVDRQWLLTHAVRQFWAELGGTMAAGDVEGPASAGAVVLASHAGRPLAELLRGVMKRSDNALARLVYLQLGAQAAQPGESTLAAADRSVRAWFAAHGLDDRGLVLDNGSGLSRSERISPAQLAGLLRVAQAGAQAPELLATLPIAGVDGTLSRRLKDGPATGRARLKTGTLRGAVGLAGLVPDASGRAWVFVALLNHPDAAARGRPVLDALVNWVAARR